MSIGAWAIRQRAFVLLALVLLTAGGLLAATRLPAGIYPEVDFPRIVVVARGGDSEPEVYQRQVTIPLEQGLATTLGVRQVRARTIRGATEISLLFAPGTDMWRALQLVQAQVNATRNALPAGTEFEVERLTPTAFPVVTYNLAGPLDGRDLRDLADQVVRPALARVPGVGQVRVTGGDRREIEVVLDGERAAGLHLNLTAVANRLRDRLVLAAAGRTEGAAEAAAVMVSADPRDAAELAEVPIAVGPGGAAIALGNVARVYEGHEDRTARVGGPRGETVILSVSRAEGASTSAVVEAVRVAVRDVARSLPPGTTLTPVYDQATLVEESVASVRDAIGLGVLLCLLVLGVSLRDLRAGLVAAAVVPAVLASCFVAMKAAGQSLNIMSLGGLAVAVGLVIDDAIIVVEAIARHLEEGVAPEEAARRGTDDLAAAVIGTTATTVVVFLPLAFVEGLVGSFFGALAGTLSAAVLLSLVVSLTAVPAVAARWFVRREGHARVSTLDRVYAALADWGARRRWVGAVLVAAAVAASVALEARVESGFLPTMDEGAFVLDYFLPAGTSLTETERVAREIERVLRETPEVANFARRTGAELGPAAATTPNRGDIMVRLRPHSGKSTEEVIEALRRRVAEEVPRARTEFILVLQDVLNDLSGAPHPVEVKLFGEDTAVLARLSEEVTTRLGHVRGLADLYGGVEPPASAEVFVVDQTAAAALHRTPREVHDELTAAVAGVHVGAMRRFDRLVPVRVRYADDVRWNTDRLLALPLLLDGATGAVPLSAVASRRHERVASELFHEDLQPVVTVTAELEGRDLGSVDRDVRAAMAGLRLPPGYRVEYGGQQASQREAFRNLVVVALGGLLLTLLVLTAQFRRLRPSVAVLLTAPFALVGALLTLWATHTPLNVSSMMGCVLLVGLEVKSGILLLELAQAHAAAGMDPVRAVVEAGRRRIRPIMLTTTATLVGVAPLALGIGAGTDVLRPLAMAVLGGIAVSKFLNLVALPSLAVLCGLGEGGGEWRATARAQGSQERGR